MKAPMRHLTCQSRKPTFVPECDDMRFSSDHECNPISALLRSGIPRLS